jgi:hypothetical protein
MLTIARRQVGDFDPTAARRLGKQFVHIGSQLVQYFVAHRKNSDLESRMSKY